MFTPVDKNNLTTLILAGGKASRLGGNDKGLVNLQGRPIIEYVINSITKSVDKLLISANRNPEQYQQYGYPLVTDSHPDYPGPMAGLFAGLQHCETDWMLSVPCDTPFLPVDLVSRMMASANHEQQLLTVAHDGTQLQSVCLLLHRSLLDSLQQHLDHGKLKMRAWINQQAHAVCDFSDCPNAFFNINSQDDLKHAESCL